MVNYVRIYFSEGDTLGVRFFTAFCNHWHCTFAMVLSLLCNHWQFLLGFLQWLNKTKIQKNTKPRNQKAKKTKKTKKNKKKAQKNDKTQLSATTPPLGVCNLVFFWFVVFLFFGFLVSGSLLVFLQWLNKTKIQKNKKPKDQKNKQLQKNWQDPTLCHYSPLGVCNLGFFVFLFIWFFGFLFFSFLVSWFLVFWFVVGFLKGWQNNTKVKDLDLTLPVLPL